MDPGAWGGALQNDSHNPPPPPFRAEDRSTAARVGRQRSVRATDISGAGDPATTADVERTSDASLEGQSCGRRQLVLQPSFTSGSSVR
eukprot:1628537-Prymnesium_polylepis.1